MPAAFANFIWLLLNLKSFPELKIQTHMECGMGGGLQSRSSRLKGYGCFVSINETASSQSNYNSESLAAGD